MDVTEAIGRRYSCRKYSNKIVTKDQIVKILKMANLAPSAGNGQNRQFVVVTDKTDREWLGKMNNQEHMAEAPVNILVTTRLSQETAEDYLESLEKWEMTHNGQNPAKVTVDENFLTELREMKYKWMISDVAAAVENLMLVATDMGLVTCWIGIMDFQGVIKRFDLPEGVIPVCWVTLGYPAENAKPKQRKPIKEMTHWGRW